MPKKIDEELISKIEKIYLADESETYSSLAARFQVGLSTLERIGKERNWARKRDQQKARRADKLIKQSEFIVESVEKLDFAQFDEFNCRRLLRSVRKSLMVFEAAIDQHADNPRIISSLVGGLTKLIEIHLKLQPPSVNDFVEMAIQAGVSPDNFFAKLSQEKERLN